MGMYTWTWGGKDGDHDGQFGLYGMFQSKKLDPVIVSDEGEHLQILVASHFCPSTALSVVSARHPMRHFDTSSRSRDSTSKSFRRLNRDSITGFKKMRFGFTEQEARSIIVDRTVKYFYCMCSLISVWNNLSISLLAKLGDTLLRAPQNRL